MRLGHHTRAQVLAGISLGSAVALVWMLLWLGWDGIGKLAGREFQTFGPGWVNKGAQEQGKMLEAAAEDAAFLALEAWQQGDWRLLKSIELFPHVEL